MKKQPNTTTPNTHKAVAFLDKPAVRIAIGLLSLAMAYVFVSWAIDSGSLFDYAIAILLVITGGRELIAGIRQRTRRRSAHE
jgi:uncharacterized membrane protein HdeD (DUF308 family)